VEVCTVGFTQHRASEFFGKLRAAGVDRLIDVRINNVSQLAGFAKRDDLAWFLKELCGAEYRHEPLLAPTKELLKRYQDKELTWLEYEDNFLQLMADRRIAERIDPAMLGTRPVLLCSEHTAEHCHRRLVVEYLREHRYPDMVIRHL
jgi:uncharacterized protein (DUF488 family)